MAPTYDLTNVLVGVSWLYLADADAEYPDDSVAYGAVAAPWTYVGATEEGVNQGFERDLTRHMVEEQSSPARITVNSSTISVSTSLAEYTLANIKTSFGGGKITNTPAGANQVGKSRMTLSDDLTEMAVLLEGKNPEGFWRRYYIPRVLSVASVETAHRRSESKKLLPVTLEAICDIGEIFIEDMTAVAAG